VDWAEIHKYFHVPGKLDSAQLTLYFSQRAFRRCVAEQTVARPALSRDAAVARKGNSVVSEMSPLPLLTIAIPTYKREALLGRLLDSIRSDAPVIVSDNGGYLSETFKRRHFTVQFISDREVPVAENWNRVASAAASRWILMPGDDDLYYPESFTVIERILREHTSADIVFFGHHVINEIDQIKSTWSPESCHLSAPQGFELVKFGTPARPPGIAFKAELFRRLGGFCTDFRVTATDNHFYQRAVLVGESVFVGDVVTGYRVWESGSTKQSIATQDWMREIDLWCNLVRRFAVEQVGYQYPLSLQDDIYLANLRAGIRVLKERGGYWAAWRHFFRSRYPFRASALGQLKLFVHLLLTRQR
jgi:glycosyltransferase involved in cell wall biosynthesis